MNSSQTMETKMESAMCFMSWSEAKHLDRLCLFDTNSTLVLTLDEEDTEVILDENRFGSLQDLCMRSEHQRTASLNLSLHEFMGVNVIPIFSTTSLIRLQLYTSRLQEEDGEQLFRSCPNLQSCIVQTSQLDCFPRTLQKWSNVMPHCLQSLKFTWTDTLSIEKGRWSLKSLESLRKLSCKCSRQSKMRVTTHIQLPESDLESLTLQLPIPYTIESSYYLVALRHLQCTISNEVMATWFRRLHLPLCDQIAIFCSTPRSCSAKVANLVWSSLAIPERPRTILRCLDLRMRDINDLKVHFHSWPQLEHLTLETSQNVQVLLEDVPNLRYLKVDGPKTVYSKHPTSQKIQTNISITAYPQIKQQHIINVKQEEQKEQEYKEEEEEIIINGR